MAKTTEAERTFSAEEADHRGRSETDATPTDESTKPKRKRKGVMSEAHKEALSEGREQSRVVNRYLSALEEHKPKRGRKVTPETLGTRLNETREKILFAPPGEKLLLISEEMDLENRIEQLDVEFDFSELESGFVKVAKNYAMRRNIPRKAFVRIGVPAAVLKDAGI